MKIKDSSVVILLLTCFVFSIIPTLLNAAFLRNKPTTITQPDGTTIECFTSGDEFNHWLHDKDNYTIIKSPVTGYYTYAEKDGEDIKAGSLIVGRDDTMRYKLVPETNISKQLYKAKREEISNPEAVRSSPTTGTFNNLVIFIRFSDEDEFTENIATYEGWFNTNIASMKNYFMETSYNQLTVNTYMYPPPSGGIVTSFQDSHPRGYYQPYDTTNTDGYTSAAEKLERCQSMNARAINHIASFVPPGLDIDANDDGDVDNVVFLYRGVHDDNYFWPHMGYLSAVTVYINGKRAYTANIQIEDFQYSEGSSVLCHEFFHSLGAPDLYHYADDSTYSPAHKWDLMNTNTNPPQHMNAYMKWKYGHWISTIPTITLDQSYTLNPATFSSGIAYRINSPYSSTEFYIVEYRRKTGVFEISIPGSGILVWRVNTACGEGNASGPPDEMYVYRPNGTLTENGSPDNAFFSIESGRYSIDASTNPDPFLSDGSPGGLVLNNIGSAGSTISFVKGTPAGITIDFSTNPYIEGFEGTNFPPPYWLHYRQSGIYGLYSDDYCVSPDAYPHSGNLMAVYPNRLLQSGNSSVLTTPRINITDIDNYDYNVSFWIYRDDGLTQNADRIEIYLNRTANLEGTPTLLGTIHRSTALTPVESSAGWHQYSYSFLVPETGIYHIVLKVISAAGNNMYIDDFQLGRIEFPITTSKWMGTVSTDWSATANWRLGYVPNAARDVIVLAGTPYCPVIQGSNASCRDLFIGADASITINNVTLYVERNGTIDGNLVMNSTAPKVIVSGDLSFNGTASVSGSSSNLEIDVYGNCTINTTSNLTLSNGLLKLMGSQTTLFTCNAPQTVLYNLTIQKNAAIAYLSMLETCILMINGILTVSSSAKLTALLDNCNVTCYDDVTANGDIEAYIGTFTFAGSLDMTLSTTSFLNNVDVINNSTLTLQTNMKLLGDVNFETGYIYALNKTINAGGDWLTSSSARFMGTGSTVIFNGLEDQICRSTYFNNLILHNNNSKLIITTFNTTVSANSFDYISGTLELNGGSFTAYDLEDSNIKGKYILNSGTINLTQDSGHYTDLDADITINDGTMNIYGGVNFPIDWAYTRDITVNMSGGLLVFHDNGIGLTNTGHTLTLIITGGTIRTTGSFIVNRASFYPTGGTIELTGSNDVNVSQHIASSFYNLRVNKSASREDVRTRSNKVTLLGNITVDNDLTIAAGTLSLGTFTCNVTRDVHIYSAMQMSQSSATLNANRDVTWYTGCSADVSAGNINVKRNWTFQSGATIELDSDNTVSFVGTENSELTLLDEDACFRNLVINKSVGTAAIASGTQKLSVSQNMTINPGNTFNFKTASSQVNGLFTANGTSSLEAGCVMNLKNFNLIGTMNLVNAYVYINESFVQQTTGILNIQPGVFVINTPYTGTLYAFGGEVNLNGGTLQITNDGIQFGASSQFHQSGGFLKIGWGFKATALDVFHPTAGSVEFIGNRSADIQCNNGNFFFDLVFSKASQSNFVTFSTDVIVNNDLIVNNGNPILFGHTLNVNSDVRIMGGLLSAGNVLDVINVKGVWTNVVSPDAFAEGSGTVNFISSEQGFISSETFNIVNVTKNSSAQFDLVVTTGEYVTVNGLLTINSGCLKVQNGSTLEVDNSIMISSGGGLNLDSTINPATLRLAGNLYDSNTLFDADLGFHAIDLNHVILDGSSDQTLSGNYADMYFCDLTVNKSGGMVLPSQNSFFWGDFRIQNGNWYYNNSGKTKTFNGDVIIDSGGIFSDSTGTSVFQGNRDSNLKIEGIANFGNLTLCKPDVYCYNLTGNTTFSGTTAITLSSGTLHLNGYTLKYKGYMNVLTDGEICLSSGSLLDIDNASMMIIGSGGRFSSMGTGFLLAHVTSSTGYYSFRVENSGTLATEHTVFEYMDANGIFLDSLSTLDEEFSFNGCYFQNGSWGGTLLNINCQENMTIWYATFPTNTWGSAYNVSRSQSLGTITFRNYGGAFSGDTYDYNPHNNIIWGALTPPDTPQNLRIEIVDNQAVLSWDPVPGIPSYRIYRALSYENLGSAEAVGTTDLTTWGDESVIIYPNAFYYVKAYIE